MTTYRGEVFVEIELDLDDEDAFDEAYSQIETIMQRAWDTDQGRHFVKKWRFEMAEDSITAAGSPA